MHAHSDKGEFGVNRQSQLWLCSQCRLSFCGRLVCSRGSRRPACAPALPAEGECIAKIAELGSNTAQELELEAF